MSNPQALMKQMMTRILQMSKILIHKTKIKQNMASSSDTTNREHDDDGKSSEKANQSDKTSRQDEIDTKQQSAIKIRTMQVLVKR